MQIKTNKCGTMYVYYKFRIIFCTIRTYELNTCKCKLDLHVYILTQINNYQWCGVKEIKWLSPLRVTKIVVTSISILVKNMYAKNKNAYLKNVRG